MPDARPALLERTDLMRLLNFIQEPLYIVSRSGKILLGNNTADALMGGAVAGRHLAEIVATPADELETYLRRCAGSGSPVVGALSLRDRDGKARRVQVKGALLGKDHERGDRILLRCNTAAFREFAHLSGQVAALNEETRKLQRARAILEEALSQRELMLRELQHRVRNQTQMMLGMVAAAKRDAKSDELSFFLDGLQRRLTAVGTVQQLMYTSTSFETISARSLIEKLCGTIGDTWPPGATVATDCVDAHLSNDTAVSLALIINELLSNALKHGLAFGAGTVRVVLSAKGTDLVLVVSDPGSGMVEPIESRQGMSGLALVRGLCRQIGGAFSVHSNGGSHCTVRFPQPEIQ